jgi:hypothetical protein
MTGHGSFGGQSPRPLNAPDGAMLTYGVQPGNQTGITIARIVIIYSSGTGAVSGLFVYNGTPAYGNPPVFAVVAPGVTQDPYGNAVEAVMNIGDLAAAHLGADDSGNLYLADSTGDTRIYLSPSLALMAIYTAGTAGLLATIAGTAGTEPLSHSSYDAGIAAYVTLTGTYAGVHAVELANQTTPYGPALAGLTIKNTTHPPAIPPGMAGACDSTGSRYRILSGAGSAGDNYFVIDTWSEAANPYSSFFPGALCSPGPAVETGTVELATIFVSPVSGGTLCQLVADTWNYVGSGTAGPIATPPGFASDWANYGHGGADLAYRLCPDGDVEITGVITPSAGAAGTVFTIPGAYAPASDQAITGYDQTGASIAAFSIVPSGAVSLFTTPAAGHVYWISGRYNISV